jgi:Leucine-rich repeat (LRR) protein
MTKAFSKTMKFNSRTKYFLHIIVYPLISLLVSCGSKKSKSIFQSFVGASDIEINLSDFKLDSVPNEIETLKGVRRLCITKEGTRGWTSYPPLSALGQSITEPPFRYLPEEMANLTTLQSLTLVNLDLVTLPDNIDRLQNLDSLILFQNKLTISKEIGKLQRLKRLKYLGIIGNHVTANDLEQLQASIPGISINSELR